MKSVAKILTENQKNLKDASDIGYDDELDCQNYQWDGDEVFVELGI